MKKSKSMRLVPLNVMIAPEQLQWIIDESERMQESMGRTIRRLIGEKLRNATSNQKGEDR